MDQPGKVANPARGQLNRENEYFPVSVTEDLSERDGSHTREVVLYWALVEQARHEHMSDEYKDLYIIIVLW